MFEKDCHNKTYPAVLAKVKKMREELEWTLTRWPKVSLSCRLSLDITVIASEWRVAGKGGRGSSRSSEV